jgi:hypothetical protein
MALMASPEVTSTGRYVWTSALKSSSVLIADPANDGAHLEGDPGNADATGAGARAGEQVRGLLRLTAVGGELTTAIEREGALEFAELMPVLPDRGISNRGRCPAECTGFGDVEAQLLGEDPVVAVVVPTLATRCPEPAHMRQAVGGSCSRVSRTNSAPRTSPSPVTRTSGSCASPRTPPKGCEMTPAGFARFPPFRAGGHDQDGRRDVAIFRRASRLFPPRLLPPS